MTHWIRDVRPSHGAGAALKEELRYSAGASVALVFLTVQMVVWGLGEGGVSTFLTDRWLALPFAVVLWRAYMASMFRGGPVAIVRPRPLRQRDSERVVKRLLENVRDGVDISTEMAALVPMAEEGNVDELHLDAALAVLVGARYTGDRRLATRTHRHIGKLLEPQWQLLPVYRAWILRAERLIGQESASTTLLPPDRQP